MSEWISVKDRLPDEDELRVLVVANGRINDVILQGAYELAEYLGNGVWILDNTLIAETQDFEVTHWMPLPEPPKGEE